MADWLQIMAFRPPPSEDCSSASVLDQWDVFFSRFLVYRPTPPSSAEFASPVLIPRRRLGMAQRAGTWLSSESAASLELYGCGLQGDAILVVCLGGKLVMEEHFISHLHFTCPQVLCVSGFPARGSRVVLVSYRDDSDEVQKFALRFQTNCEAEAFMNVVQETLHNLDNGIEIELPSPPTGSGMSSHSEFVSSDVPSPRSHEEVVIASPVKLEFEAQHCENLKGDTNNHLTDAPHVVAAYPPSFTSLLTNGQAETEKVMAQPSSEEDLIKSQIMMYMEDAAFQDMLMSVEKVIGELGVDLAM